MRHPRQNKQETDGFPACFVACGRVMERERGLQGSANPGLSPLSHFPCQVFLHDLRISVLHQALEVYSSLRLRLNILARPPSEVSRKRWFMLTPVSYMVLTTMSKEIRWVSERK